MEVVVAGHDGEQRRRPQPCLADQRNRHGGRPGIADDEEAQRHHLQHGLPFREPAHGHADVQAGQELAQARYENLAAQDDERRQDHEARDAVEGNQHQDHRRDEELVGDRVEEAAEGGNLRAAARDIAV